jgi:hypothetical protein
LRFVHADPRQYVHHSETKQTRRPARGESLRKEGGIKTYSAFAAQGLEHSSLAKHQGGQDELITTGIHFESDKIAGLKLGVDVANAMLERAKTDGSQ